MRLRNRNKQTCHSADGLCEDASSPPDVSFEDDNGCVSLTEDYPPFITTYTSGSFIISKENILFYPIEFYHKLFDQLYHGPKGSDRTCGILEYMWSTIWGSDTPFEDEPDPERWCGPLYFADIEVMSGFIFTKSDDLSVEKGRVPEGYHGYIRVEDNILLR